jgi:hypothetical protein
MNTIFRGYPEHPWLNEWTFEPRGCGTTYREKNAGYFFHALDTVGRISPNHASAEWSLQVPVPQNSRINLLFNGFCGYFNRFKRQCAAEVIIPEPGVMWGHFSDIPAPALITEAAVVEADGFQWLESDEIPALLAVRNNSFCLVTKARILNDAAELAESYLAQDIEAHLRDEFEQRAGAAKLFEQMSHHDSLAVISTECMMRALRPPEGNIPGIWSQSPSSETPQLNMNELYALALAWRHIDIRMAEDLVRTALKLQASSGAIPVTFSPHETFSVLEAPKPVLVKTAEKVWQISRDPQFLNEVLPPLRRHVQWLLHHFDPKRRGLHCWQNRNELLTPDLYESDLATVDLTILLMGEIEALNRLREASPAYADHPPYFPDDHDTLEHNLQNQFWNENEGIFSNAIARGRMIQIQGFPTFMPLVWSELPLRQKGLMLDRIKESGILPGGVSVLSWRQSAIDDHSFSLLQQLLVLETLKAAEPHGTLISDFARITLQGFVEWQTLSIEEHGSLQIDPVKAAYIMNLQETHHYRYHAKDGFSGFMFNVLRKTRADRFDLAVILVTLFAVLSVHTLYKLMRRPPPLLTLEAKMNNAYANKNAAETLENCLMLIEHYPEHAALARLLAGNISLIQNNAAQAIGFFSAVRKDFPDSPGPMIALGLAYQLQGRFKEADANYAEFTYLFDEIFPELVSEIQRYRYLMSEGFRSPPKWAEIYRYQLMHEL